MTTRLGPQRRPPEPASGGMSGLLWSRLAGLVGAVPTEEEKLQAQAARGARLAAMLRGDPVPHLWDLDLRPLFLAMFDDITARQAVAMERGESSERVWFLGGALYGLKKFAETLDAELAKGDGAMERLAARHITQAAQVEAAKERSA